ncbi:hypothetical protein FXV91_17455 [Methanosarcina sp. DH2]|jgi:hypothetical protein|uniref:hypothetical protein n=1 Tax=Methanosarcina sp. DH2 TaxID=2605639 RepID=UPI001E470951|nr:hypothetical protein [Methanosarcina sp. DH2]MCC4771883.1 hypothetical protein [Methanosarcina sp. DH2]
MLLPLKLVLFIRAKYKEVASGLPTLDGPGCLSSLVLFVAFFVVYISDLIGVIGSTAIIAAVVLLLTSCFIAYFLGEFQCCSLYSALHPEISQVLAIASLIFMAVRLMLSPEGLEPVGFSPDNSLILLTAELDLVRLYSRMPQRLSCILC